MPDKLHFFNGLLKFLTKLIVNVYKGVAEDWEQADLSFLQYLLKKMVNLQLKFSGSDLDLNVLIDAFFLAVLSWVSQETGKASQKETMVGVEQILDTLGFVRVW